MKYPNIKKGIRWGCVVGGVFAPVWVAVCCWSACSVTDAETSLRIGPWWLVARQALTIFVFAGILAGLLAAVRPEFKKWREDG